MNTTVTDKLGSRTRGLADAREAVECGMVDVACQTFAASMRLRCGSRVSLPRRNTRTTAAS